MLAKRRARADLLRGVARQFTEELGVHALSRKDSAVDRWNKGGALPPLAL